MTADSEQLIKYLPSYGHRIAAVAYATRKQREEVSRNQPTNKKDLIERLKGVNATEHNRRSVPQKGNQNARKVTRRLEVGWLDTTKTGFSQVKSQRGGGTRQLLVDWNCRISEIEQTAKNLFFPEGNSQLGQIDIFNFHMADFSRATLENQTVSEMYDSTKVKLLKLYLVSKRKMPEMREDDDGAGIQILQSMKKPRTRLHRKNTTKSDTPVTLPDSEQATFTYNSLPPQQFVRIPQSTQNVDWSQTPQTFDIIPQSFQDMDIFQSPQSVDITPQSTQDMNILHTPQSVDITSQSTQDLNIFQSPQPIDKTPQSTQDVNSFQSPQSVDITQGVVCHAAELSKITPSTKLDILGQSDSNMNLELIDVPFVDFDDSEINGLLNVPGNTLNQFLNDTIPCTVLEVKVHRGNVLEELITYFVEHKNEIQMRGTKLEIKMVLPNGSMEVGEDNGGVLRDALSEFWEAFYVKHTDGEAIKVPIVSNTMTESRWKACGAILIIGYKQEGYFPVKLAIPFLKKTLGGSYSPCDEMLVKHFLQYLPEMDSEVLSDALEDIDSVDMSDLIEVLDTQQVTKYPSKENIHNVVVQIAHRKLLQESSYVSECWEELFVKELQPLLKGDIDELCTELKPTTKKVLAILDFGDLDQMTLSENTTMEYLRKFVKTLKQSELSRFLRFVTGSDLLVAKTIWVRFIIPPSDFQRSPLAHTCGCVLELPKTYKTFQEFRQEFTTLLAGIVWVMDAI